MNLPKINTANTKLPIVVGITIFFIFVNTAIFSNKTKAAALYLNPATGSVLTSTFDITLSLDAETDTNIKGSDVYLTFDNTLVQVEKIDKLAFTSNSTATYNNTLGTIHIKGDLSTTPTSNSITNIAKIYLKVKPNTKGKAVNFTFEEGTSKTNVYNNSNTSATLKMVGADLLIDVSTSTNTTVTSNSTSTSIPKTGNSTPLYFVLISIFSLIFSSLFLRKNAFSKL